MNRVLRTFPEEVPHKVEMAVEDRLRALPVGFDPEDDPDEATGTLFIEAQVLLDGTPMIGPPAVVRIARPYYTRSGSKWLDLVARRTSAYLSPGGWLTTGWVWTTE